MKLLFLFCYLLVASLAYGQPIEDMKRDYFWVLAYDWDSGTSEVDAIIFDFNHDTVQITHTYKEIEMYGSNGSISDENGNLLIYSNGCNIAGADHEIIPGGDTINYSNLWLAQCGGDGTAGYSTVQGLMVLPIPKRTNIFNVFYLRRQYYDGVGGRTDQLSKAQVEYSDSEASFVVTSKAIPLVNDTFLLSGHLAACRHGNGSDWWIVATDNNENLYYKFLLTKDTITGPIYQHIGAPYTGSFGGSVFTPDGARYISYEKDTDLKIFDFDRCTGEFSNPLHIPILDAADTVTAAGCSVSPSSRFLYLASSLYIYQFDLWAQDIASTKTTVAVYDGYEVSPGLANMFYQMQLAPDGKIYVTAQAGRRTVHVIEHPDSAGLACNVVQHKHIFPVAVGRGLPYFPNFRLGPIVEVVPSFSYTAVGDSVFFQNNSVGGTEWLWDFGDGGISTEASPSHIYAQPGMYGVRLTATESCVAEEVTDTVMVIFSGTESGGTESGLYFYPNPAKGSGWLSVPERVRSMGAKWEVKDAIGRTVRSEGINNEKEKISFIGLPFGVYFLSVRANGFGAIWVEKVVIY